MRFCLSVFFITNILLQPFYTAIALTQKSFHLINGDFIQGLQSLLLRHSLPTPFFKGIEFDTVKIWIIKTYSFGSFVFAQSKNLSACVSASSASLL